MSPAPRFRSIGVFCWSPNHSLLCAQQEWRSVRAPSLSSAREASWCVEDTICIALSGPCLLEGPKQRA